ncbi:vWA domain-containing protein [Paracoccaceae bacterium GXU_MW_L88]
MLVRLFEACRAAKIPVSIREYLTLLGALDAGLADMDVTEFYYLARASLVKDERNLDKFDRVFGQVFKGMEGMSLADVVAATDIPEDWLRKLAEKHLTPEEMAEMEGAGSLDELMKKLAERLAEQKDRHQGGNKWIGTGGTSPFGAYGSNPAGVRIGQDKSRHQRAAKVWDKREFRNLDDSIEIGTRNIKVALKRLRKWARDGAAEELDLDGTIHSTAHHGYLDVVTRPERRNAVKVLLFLDVGGSMDPHIRMVEELFSAAKAEFKHLEYFYFHNCIYEGLWKDNRRRFNEVTMTWDVLHRFGGDYKAIFVGDASMSPWEIAVPGGANEYVNAEAGQVWLQRLREHWPDSVWINPVPEAHWGYTESIGMIRQIFEERMYPMTLQGLEEATKALAR